MDLTGVFNNLGLGKEYSLIYMTLVKNGQMRAMDISKKTNLPRTSCYEYFPKLEMLGLISEIKEGKSKFYKASPPEALMNLLYKQKNSLNFNINTFESDFSKLKELYEFAESKIDVCYHHGAASIKKVLIANSTRLKTIVTAFGSQNTWGKIPKNVRIIKLTNPTDQEKYIFDDMIIFVDLDKQIAVCIKDANFANLENAIAKKNPAT